MKINPIDKSALPQTGGDFGASDHFFKQATRKNITRTILISKKPNLQFKLCCVQAR